MRTSSAAFRLFAALLMPVGSSLRGTDVAAQGPPVGAPCQIAGLVGDVRCFTVYVDENPSRSGGRRLGIFVVVAKATGSSAAADPFILLAGGPGQAGSDMGPFAVEAFSAVRSERDLVLLDYRGTGRSSPLRCALFRTAADLGGATMYPTASLVHCRDSLAAHADLAQYTTDRIADDIAHVQRTMRWPAINVYGTSYGSRVAFALMRRHPKIVRSVVMKAVAPPTLVAPMHYARDAERAWSLLERDCRADSACARHAPALRQDLDSVLTLARLGMIRGVGPRGEPVTVSAEAVAVTLMGAMQSTGDRSRIPLLLAMTRAGQTGLLAGLVLRARLTIDSMLSAGMHLSVLCSEDAQRLDVTRAVQEARGTFLGASRVQMTAEACRHWPRGSTSRAAADPVRSDVPTLLVSGELDPNLPPVYADEALRSLRRGQHVVLRGVAHGWWAVAQCGANFVAEFVRLADATPVDASCGERSSAPPFAVPPPR